MRGTLEQHTPGAQGGIEPLVAMRGISKSFGENKVLRDVDFELYSGEVHALLGENGAGKSTLMKILMGVYRPDQGRVYLDQVDITNQSIQGKMNRGISMIFQELSLLPNLTVAENILLGHEPRRAGWRIDFRKLRKQAQELLDTYKFPIRAGAKVAGLGFAQRQTVEIVKSLASGARVLIMDEPTSSLTVREEDKLFSIIRSLKENGIGIIYISHRMAEIFKISDRISVVKDGNLLPTQASSETNIQQIAELMSRARTPTSVATGTKASTYDNDRPALRITGLRTARKLRQGIDLEIAKGEILGLAGLVGCGRTTLAKALFGLLPDAVGSVEIDGKPLKLGSPTRAIAAGLGFVPEDRRREGLVIDHGIAINIALPSLMKLRVSNGRFPILMPNSADGLFDHMRSQLKIVCRAGRQHARELSGGNQQKVVVAKWLATNARLLILDEPTAGVDVNAKEEMRLIIRDAASRGMAVLLIASEMEELTRVADRIVTMVDGTLGRTLPSGATETELRAALQVDLEEMREGTA